MFIELNVSGKPRLVNFNFVEEVLTNGKKSKIVFHSGTQTDLEIIVDESYHFIKRKLAMKVIQDM